MASGNTNLTTTRNALGTASAISGASAFQFYKVVFPTIRGSDGGNYWMQLNEILLQHGSGTAVGGMPQPASNTPSLVTRNGPVFSMAPDFSGLATVTATLSASGSGRLVVVTPSGSEVANGASLDSVTVQGNGTTTLQLSGTLAAIHALMSTPGRLLNSVSLAGQDVAVRLSYNGFAMTKHDPGNGMNTGIQPLDFYGPSSPITSTVVATTLSGGATGVGEEVSKVNDLSTLTKYLNLSGPGQGFVVTLDAADVLDSLLVVSRTNDDIARWDPATWEVYGSNSNLAWNGEWGAALGSGSLNLTPDKGSMSVVSFNNRSALRYYKVVFPTIRATTPSGFTVRTENYLHISEAHLFKSARFKLASAGSLAQRPDLRTLAGNGWTQRMWFDLTTGNNATLATLLSESATSPDLIRIQAGSLQTSYSQSDLDDPSPRVGVELQGGTNTFRYEDYGQIASAFFSTATSG